MISRNTNLIVFGGVIVVIAVFAFALLQLAGYTPRQEAQVPTRTATVVRSARPPLATVANTPPSTSTITVTPGPSRTPTATRTVTTTSTATPGLTIVVLPFGACPLCSPTATATITVTPAAPTAIAHLDPKSRQVVDATPIIVLADRGQESEGEEEETTEEVVFEPEPVRLCLVLNGPIPLERLDDPFGLTFNDIAEIYRSSLIVPCK